MELLNQKVDPESATPDNTASSDATATGSSEALPTDNKAASTTTSASQVTPPHKRKQHNQLHRLLRKTNRTL